MCMQAIKIKIQLPLANEIAMGPGKAQLLLAIHQHGSISAAAKSMKMSYKRAWDLVAIMNHAFKEPLVVTSVGGQHGGGAGVTPFGLLVLQSYQALQQKTADFVDTEATDLLALLARANDSEISS